MHIVFVVDMYDVQKNGTTMTSRRMAEALARRGHEVRVIYAASSDQDRIRPQAGDLVRPFCVGQLKVPVLYQFMKAQHVTMGRPDEAVIRQALQGADVVHLFLPFPLEKQALQVARQMHIPVTAAFHLQPENVSYNIGLGRSKSFNRAIYSFFKQYLYQYVSRIHCPSEFIARQLQAHQYQARLYVISNGVPDLFRPAALPPPDPQPGAEIPIIMVGRLSPEKNQAVLLKAVLKSRYAKRIRVTLAGQGPDEAKLRRLGQQLPLTPEIAYFTQPELLVKLQNSVLYVHTASAEIEAIACLEAVACGLVPIISNSEQSATPQFALDERSLFQPDSVDDLAHKLDYWLDHPQERQAMGKQYAASAEAYRLDKVTAKLEQMLTEAVECQQEPAAVRYV
ncbi:MAG: glycosyltransferase [Oscillospiraceae bacterium]|nr:glycosyltransferase [Oscillospiraceae bacterium]MDD4368436.1 glycosyltransferase [Oscillospiraceae bacterium]